MNKSLLHTFNLWKKISNKFDTKSCNNDNLIKWHYYLDTVAADQGIKASDYNHKILLLPKGFASKMPGRL